jgi:hypothetical protein
MITLTYRQTCSADLQIVGVRQPMAVSFLRSRCSGNTVCTLSNITPCCDMLLVVSREPAASSPGAAVEDLEQIHAKLLALLRKQGEALERATFVGLSDVERYDATQGRTASTNYTRNWGNSRLPLEPTRATPKRKTHPIQTAPLPTDSSPLASTKQTLSNSVH